jgi:hypothetical protein
MFAQPVAENRRHGIFFARYGTHLEATAGYSLAVMVSQSTLRADATSGYKSVDFC